MLDKKNMDEMESYLKEEDAQREQLLARSRIVLKNSKAAIYSIHRKELDKAKGYIADSEIVITEMKKITEKYPHLVNHVDNALEEYCEACVFYGYVTEKKIPTNTKLKLNPIVYLGGLSDLTGELGRMAVLDATAKNTKSVEQIRDLIDMIHGAFIRFDLRNGDLRKKADSIKWNLNKVEELLYDLKKKE